MVLGVRSLNVGLGGWVALLKFSDKISFTIAVRALGEFREDRTNNIRNRRSLGAF